MTARAFSCYATAMAMARNRRDRMHQILAWLQKIHPAPYKVRLRIEKIPKSADAFADCGRHGPRGRLFLIRLEPAPWRVMTDRLLHGACLRSHLPPLFR